MILKVINFIWIKSFFFFCVSNLVLSALIIVVIIFNFSASIVLVSALLLLLMNFILLILKLLKVREFNNTLGAIKKGKAQTIAPTDILSDIDLEFKRRRAAKKFERN